MRWLLNLWPFVTKRAIEREADEWADLLGKEIDAKIAEAERRRAAEKAADDLYARFLEAVAEANRAVDLGEKAVEIGDCLRAQLAAADEQIGIVTGQRDALLAARDRLAGEPARLRKKIIAALNDRN